MRRKRFRSLPRWVRRLWLVIFAVACLDVALVATALAVPGDWTWLALQFVGLSVVPLALGTLLALLAGSVTTQWQRGREASAPKEESSPTPSGAARHLPHEGGGGVAETPGASYEIVVARGAARLFARAARSREGKAAVRAAAKLVDRVQAAARESPAPQAGRKGEGDPDRPNG